MSDLIEFYGKECSFCIKMEPFVERLEKEEGVEIEKFEVWHSEENARKFKEADQGRCSGVPFFLNKKSGKFICGYAEYEKLKEWAKS